jgi:magnesium transporter
MEEVSIHETKDIRPFLEKWPVTWVNVEGLGDVETLRELGELFGLHRLSLEDVVNVHQRAKVDEYPDHQFIVARMPDTGDSLGTEQVSFFLGERFLLTFQEKSGDCFDPIRDRIRGGQGRIRRSGPDYLAYALLDSVIDAYFPVLEKHGERLESIEDEILSDPDSRTISRIHQIKRDLLNLRRIMWPQRGAVNALIRGESGLVTQETRVHLRDCYDHTIQLMDLLESYRELGSALMDLYLSIASNRMNEVMKVLTVIATIFIPLTFIAGIYGMNFDNEASPWNMPELNWYFGYPFCMGIMAVVALALVYFFWRKKWL